jgi:hypothetical protein
LIYQRRKIKMDGDKLIENIVKENREPTAEELDTFKNLVTDWFKYDDMIRKLIVALKERKTVQKALNNKIEEFMFTYKYNDLNTKDGRIKANVKNVHKPVNIKDIKDIIQNNKELSGEELLNKIFNKEDRPLITKKSIKRIIPKVSLSLDI